MQTPFIEWKQLPRGTYTANVGTCELDVFKIGDKGFRYNVLDIITGHYLASGTEATLDAACEAAIKETP